MTAEARRKLFCKHATLTRSDTTATKLFTLPDDAFIEEIIVHNYATATNATISIGNSSSSTAYVNAQSVATVGLNRVTTIGTYSKFTTRTEIYGLIGGTAVAGGPFRVTVWYTTEKAKGLI